MTHDFMMVTDTSNIFELIISVNEVMIILLHDVKHVSERVPFRLARNQL